MDQNLWLAKVRNNEKINGSSTKKKEKKEGETHKVYSNYQQLTLMYYNNL